MVYDWSEFSDFGTDNMNWFTFDNAGRVNMDPSLATHTGQYELTMTTVLNFASGARSWTQGFIVDLRRCQVTTFPSPTSEFSATVYIGLSDDYIFMTQD
jgi:hypothetical protein